MALRQLGEPDAESIKPRRPACVGCSACRTGMAVSRRSVAGGERCRSIEARPRSRRTRCAPGAPGTRTSKTRCSGQHGAPLLAPCPISRELSAVMEVGFRSGSVTKMRQMKTTPSTARRAWCSASNGSLVRDDSRADSCRRRAVQWLLDVQNDDGGWGGNGGVSPSVEETGIVLSALGHLTSGVRDERVAKAIESGARWLCDATLTTTTSGADWSLLRAAVVLRGTVSADFCSGRTGQRARPLRARCFRAFRTGARSEPRSALTRDGAVFDLRQPLRELRAAIRCRKLGASHSTSSGRETGPSAMPAVTFGVNRYLIPLMTRDS